LVAAAVGAFVGTAVGTDVEVGAVVAVAAAAAVGMGVAVSGVRVGVSSGVTSGVEVAVTAGTTVRPVPAAAVVVGVASTVETTAGLARLQPAIEATKNRTRTTMVRVFFMVASSLNLERETLITLHTSYHN
jgi:hypothetical protein